MIEGFGRFRTVYVGFFSSRIWSPIRWFAFNVIILSTDVLIHRYLWANFPCLTAHQWLLISRFFFHNRLEFKCAHFLQDYALMSGSYDDNIKTGDGGGESGINMLSIHSCGLLQTCCELALLYMHHIWVTLTSISHEIVSAIIWTSWEDFQSLCIFTRNSSTCPYDGWFSSSSLYVYSYQNQKEHSTVMVDGLPSHC